jgi:hypothetical protein
MRVKINSGSPLASDVASLRTHKRDYCVAAVLSTIVEPSGCNYSRASFRTCKDVARKQSRVQSLRSESNSLTSTLDEQVRGVPISLSKGAMGLSVRRPLRFAAIDLANGKAS